MMADEFNFLWSKILNYIAEADADLIPVQGQLELHGRCRCGVLLSPCFGALFVADLFEGMEELELHYRCRGRSKFRKIRIATISAGMVPRGPKSWKISRSPSGIEIFKRDWNEWHFQARLKFSSGPPTKPLFLWGGGVLKVKIENFKRVWSVQASLKISSENLKFSSVQARLIFFKIRALWVAKHYDFCRDSFFLYERALWEGKLQSWSGVPQNGGLRDGSSLTLQPLLFWLPLPFPLPRFPISFRNLFPGFWGISKEKTLFFLSKVWTRGHCKRGIGINCPKLTFKFVTFWDNFVPSDVWNEIYTGKLGQIWRAMCDKFTQCPLRERPQTQGYLRKKTFSCVF